MHWDCLAGVFLGWNLEKIIDTFKIITFEFFKMVSFMQNKKIKFGLKNYYHIWNQCSRICQNARFCVKIEILQFGTKNSLFGYFWAAILKAIGIFEINIFKLVKLDSSMKKVPDKRK